MCEGLLWGRRRWPQVAWEDGGELVSRGGSHFRSAPSRSGQGLVPVVCAHCSV